ncbi:transcription factor MYB93 [Cucumis sativus]|uniref:transcription factor MYB93 n=1 Tax=Cucumis sativus TaxID=3659 RepID=UPI0012F48D36|nr:transcription factor MYB93 [Cucumis sativus]KAE8652367.1 hypothetical protein Csa_022335 [Cucumis sativus]
MSGSPTPEENGVKKGPWTPEEDRKLVDYIEKHGHGSWRALPKLAGLNRCGKSCRLRWTNYLRPDIKRGNFSDQEEQIIINLHASLGNKWSIIASHLPGRTDNEIKNFWNTHLKKKLLQMGIDPVTHMPITDRHHLNTLSNLHHLLSLHTSPWDNPLRLQNDATQLAKAQLLQNLLQLLASQSSLSISNNNLFNTQQILDLNYNLPIGSFFQNIPINIEPPQGPLSCDDYTAATDGALGFENDNDRIKTFYDMNQRLNSLPNLIPASPECSKIPTAIENNWDDDLMDVEASDSSWKHVIDQTPPSWTVS